METKFTEQESLTLISEMIKQARSNFRKGGGNSMVFYGALVSILAILNVILALIFHKMNINTDLSVWIWSIMIPGIFVGRLIDKKVEREAIVKTHLDSIFSSLWRGYLYAVFVFLLVIFCIGFGKKMYDVFCLINPIILIFIGLAEYVSAKAYRFKPYLFGAVIMWIGTLACIALMWTPEPVLFQFLILALCMFFGFVIPGYKLNKLAKNS